MVRPVSLMLLSSVATFQAVMCASLTFKQQLDGEPTGNVQPSVTLGHGQVLPIEESQNLSGHKGIPRNRYIVAFFATRNTKYNFLGQRQPIVFDRIITNVGLGYDNATGVFKAPVSGIYVFSTTLLVSNQNAEFQFTVNGHAYSNLYTHLPQKYGSLSQTVIFTLIKGDHVAIQCMYANRFIYGNNFSTFSGFRLA